MTRPCKISESETAESRFVPKWLFPPRFPDEDRFTCSRPNFELVTPIAAKTQTQQTTVGEWVLRSGGGNWGRLGAPQQHRQPPVEPPTPDSTDLKTSANLDVTSTSLRSSIVKTPDLRTSWTPQRNSTKISSTFSKEPPLLSTSSFRVWVAPSKTHTLKLFKELSLDSQRVKKLASKLHVHSVNFAAKLVHTRRALSSTIINSHQEPVSGQACNPLDPHCFFFFVCGKGVFRYSVAKWLTFP